MTSCDSLTPLPVEAAETTTILVVDDASIDRRIAGRILESNPTLRVVSACNGTEALEVLSRLRPGAILTDLQMDGMDGLELVRAVHERYPSVPVVLMTASGSEDIAVEALRSGAAGYVPKQLILRNLAAILARVLNAARCDHRRQRLLGSLAFAESRFVLESDPTLVPALVGYLQRCVADVGVCDRSQLIRVGVAIEEALLNGLYHGNLELGSGPRPEGAGAFERLVAERRSADPFAARRLHVTARCSESEAVLVVRDEGPGFDPREFLDRAGSIDLERTRGRGLLLIHTFMDSVSHNATGNEITLVKRAGSRR